MRVYYVCSILFFFCFLYNRLLLSNLVLFQEVR
uniref:Uncharacterized protein n=1 Tax=Myoviridae sp. ctIty1 TaxID=2827673 RepID=A0A8S5TGM3_9CAUD|nr:MAG TPA: hypothetical protein [Myoviridae sp. ctIty1]DAT42739.1 MAG TPA: hypothetical protein [Caudoviricetes sp.]